MQLMRLRHVASLSNSNVDKLTDADEVPVRLCNYVDVYKNDKIHNALEFMCASATPSEINRFRLNVGDVIITKDSEDASDIGVPAYVAETAPDLVCGYHLTLLQSIPDVMRGDFLFWSLNSKPVREQMANAANGITRFGLTLSGMKSISVPAPDIDMQKTIANFLDRETARIDQLVEKKERLVDVLKERLLSELERLTTAKKPRYNELVPFRWVCRITEGQVDPKTPEWAGKPLIAPNHIESRTGRLMAIETAEDQGATSGKYPFPAGTVVYSKIRPNLAKACVSPVAGMCSADMYPILPDKSLRPQFLLMQLLSAKFTDWAALESMRVAMPKINRETLGTYRFWVPTLDSQDEAIRCFIAEREVVEQLADKVSDSIAHMREFRSALITAAVTGQIDVTTWAKQGRTDSRLDKIEAEMSI